MQDISSASSKSGNFSSLFFCYSFSIWSSWDSNHFRQPVIKDHDYAYIELGGFYMNCYCWSRKNEWLLVQTIGKRDLQLLFLPKTGGKSHWPFLLRTSWSFFFVPMWVNLLVLPFLSSIIHVFFIVHYSLMLGGFDLSWYCCCGIARWQQQFNSYEK